MVVFFLKILNTHWNMPKLFFFSKVCFLQSKGILIGVGVGSRGRFPKMYVTLFVRLVYSCLLVQYKIIYTKTVSNLTN